MSGSRSCRSRGRRGTPPKPSWVTLAYARDAHHLKRVVAITSSDNVASINLLVKLGFYFDRMVLMPDDKDEVKLFARSLGNASV